MPGASWMISLRLYHRLRKRSKKIANRAFWLHKSGGKPTFPTPSWLHLSGDARLKGFQADIFRASNKISGLGRWACPRSLKWKLVSYFKKDKIGRAHV